jgi:hypothetical protein
MNWKSQNNCSREEKERNNKIWEFIRNSLIDTKTSLVIKLLKNKKD